jgi:GNAT superfamily N-acetyltransferase
MTHHIRAARATDVPALISLMQAFYAESDFPLASEPASRAFEALLADDRLGAIWLAEDGGTAVGHVVLTLCYSMEYGGLRGFIDDLFVLPRARGHGIAADLLAATRAGAAARGVRALHVEVGPANDTARRLYARAGYVDSGHLLLSLPLAPPLHAA